MSWKETFGIQLCQSFVTQTFWLWQKSSQQTQPDSWHVHSGCPVKIEGGYSKKSGSIQTVLYWKDKNYTYSQLGFTSKIVSIFCAVICLNLPAAPCKRRVSDITAATTNNRGISLRLREMTFVCGSDFLLPRPSFGSLARLAEWATKGAWRNLLLVKLRKATCVSGNYRFWSLSRRGPCA